MRATVSHFVWFIFHIFGKGLAVQFLAECAMYYYVCSEYKMPPMPGKIWGIYQRVRLRRQFIGGLLVSIVFYELCAFSFQPVVYLLRFRIEFEKHSIPTRVTLSFRR